MERLAEAYVEMLTQYGTGNVGYRVGQQVWSRECQDVRSALEYLKISELFEFFSHL